MERVLVLNVVGLTPGLLATGVLPRLGAWAARHGVRPLMPDLPAVTCTVQASMLTGERPSVHGAVGNGWFFRELCEVWLWRQSSRLLQADTVFERWRAEHPGSPTAQSFWWWNLPSRADLSLTPRPNYHADGRKTPDFHAWPLEIRPWLREQIGDFPLFHFWGPGAGIRSTRWITDAAILVSRRYRPGLHLVYLPHLDYDLQRFGPDSPQALRAAAEVDAEAGRLLDHAEEEGLRVVVLSEYGITAVRRAVAPNVHLRREGLLAVHPARNGALLDPGHSRAFCVPDHQGAHVYVADPADLPKVRALLEDLDGVAEILDEAAQIQAGLAHPRSGELFLVAEEDAWFHWPYWAEDDWEPDFARTVDIHRKPGYDPCELFLDPALRFPRLRLARKLLARRLGFRSVLDLIPLDPSPVRGSHGRLPARPEEGPLWIGPESLAPPATDGPLPARLALQGLFRKQA